MPWISRRALSEQAAERDRLRDRVRELDAEVLEMGRASGRIARNSGAAEACIKVENAAIRASHRAIAEKCDRQQAQIVALRKDRDRLAARTEELMYTPAERAAIESGTGEPKRTVSAR